MNFDAQEVLSKLDPLLEQHMMAEIGEGHYDYLHGALGYVLYFLNGPAAGKTELLASVMTELDRIAIKEADGSIKWRSVLDEDKGLEGFNLSLSHGLASIMIILSKIMSLGIEVDLCKKLLLGSYKYLRKQQLKGPGFASVYPSWALESLDEPSNSRMAWCYGDLGIAMACHTVGRTMNDRAIARHGDELLLSSCARKEPELNNVHDAGICHGAAGIALIYNAVYQKMPNDQIKEAAGHWLDECLKMDIHKNGIAGYSAWYHPQYGGWVKTPGLLEGAAGIGLALMSFLSTKDPAWKEALLL